MSVLHPDEYLVHSLNELQDVCYRLWRGAAMKGKRPSYLHISAGAFNLLRERWVAPHDLNEHAGWRSRGYPNLYAMSPHGLPIVPLLLDKSLSGVQIRFPGGDREMETEGVIHLVDTSDEVCGGR